MSFIHTCARGLALCLSLNVVVACSGGSSTKAIPAATQSVSGSIGDGPVVGAEVDVIDANGSVIASDVSDDQAKYSIAFPTGAAYPLTIRATAGNDLVTGRPLDFDLTVLVNEIDDQSTFNLSPMSTLSATMMNCDSQQASLDQASALQLVWTQVGMGLDPNKIDNPISDELNATNVATVLLANEALGEAIRRMSQAMSSTSTPASTNEVIDLLACDLAIDGQLGGLGSDNRQAAVFSAVQADILLELLAGRLEVNGEDATPFLDQAIATILPETNGITVLDEPASANIVAQVTKALQALSVVVADESIVEILDSLTSTDLDSIRMAIPNAVGGYDVQGLAERLALTDESDLLGFAEALASIGLDVPEPGATPEPNPTTDPLPDPPPNEDLMQISSPRNLSGSVTNNTVALTWDEPLQIGDGISHYQVYRNGSPLLDNIRTRSVVDSSVEPNRSYEYQVRAIGIENVNSNLSEAWSIDVPASADDVPPSTPSVLQASEITHFSVLLTWDASNDSGGGTVTGYRLYRDGTLFTSINSAETRFLNTGLASDTLYEYRVSAVDASDNESPQSDIAQVRTLVSPTSQADISFDSAMAVLDPGKGTGGVAVGDLDKDGRDEFVADKLKIFDWNGSSWDNHTIATASGKKDRWAGDNEVLDVNNDGWLDIVISDSSNTGNAGELTWFENPQGNLAGSWTEHSIHTWNGSGTGNRITHCEEAVGDIDGDGFSDIVVRDISHGSWVFINNRNSGFSTPKYLPHNPREGLDLADLDGDGDLDIILNGIWFETPSDPVNGSYALHAIRGMEAWYPSGSSSNQIRDYAAKVRTADVNEDGKMDIVIANSEELNAASPQKPHGVKIYLQPANRISDSWPEHVIDANHYSWHSVKVADFNSDGFPDIVAAISTVGKDSSAAEVNVWQGLGDGAFNAPIGIGSDYGYQGEVGDFDGDGLLDFFLPANFQSGDILIYRNTSN